MSESHEWAYYHLTPNGWVKGAKKVDFGGGVAGPTPNDRVRTIRYNEMMSSPFSSIDTDTEVIFEIEDKQQVEELVKKYGEQPEHMGI
jgi:phosphosulfolactate synthase (CoM biosynthesis protein A)